MVNSIYGFHHITLNVGSAQQDYDFHTKALGLKLLKRTVLYDGDCRSITCITEIT